MIKLTWGIGGVTSCVAAAALLVAGGSLLAPSAATATPVVQAAQPAPGGDAPTTGPSTQPGGRRNRGRGGPVAFVTRYHDAVWGLSNLTDDQKGKLTPIFDQAKTDAAGLADQTKDMAPEDRRDKQQAFMEDLRGKVSEVLTDDQRSELQDKMSQFRGGGGGGRRGGGGGGGPATQPGASATPDGGTVMSVALAAPASRASGAELTATPQIARFL